MVEWKSTVKFLFLDYYTTTYWNLQSGAGVQNQREALYIIIAKAFLIHANA